MAFSRSSKVPILSFGLIFNLFLHVHRAEGYLTAKQVISTPASIYTKNYFAGNVLNSISPQISSSDSNQFSMDDSPYRIELTQPTNEAANDDNSSIIPAPTAAFYTRHVKPYFQEFKTHAKGRWLGREIVDVLSREFGAHPRAYWVNAVGSGKVKVNNAIVPLTYKFKNGDLLLHRTHRHEPPVFGRVELVGQSADMLAVCKPPSLPMHPCGAYRFNSLEYVLKYEPLASAVHLQTAPQMKLTSATAGQVECSMTDGHASGKLGTVVVCGTVEPSRDISSIPVQNSQSEQRQQQHQQGFRVGSFFVVHRLDRVTSGLVVLAKTKESAARISEEIRRKTTTKIYLARVKGRFPSCSAGVPSYLRELSELDLAEFDDEVSDHQAEAKAEQQRQSQNQKKQKKQKNQKNEEQQQQKKTIKNDDDSKNNNDINNSNNSYNGQNQQVGGNKRKRSNSSEACSGSASDTIVKHSSTETAPLPFETVGAAPNVGYLFRDRVRPPSDAEMALELAQPLVHPHSAITPPDQATELQGYIDGSAPGTHDGLASHSNSNNCSNDNGTGAGGSLQEIWVRCPIAVVSHRDGIQSCNPCGKPSLSVFRALSYCALSDTTLVECRPVTGRTHQLRLHLQLLGTPIANDPCYGGELFYGQHRRKQRALEAFEELRKRGIQPLSKVPHLEPSTTTNTSSSDSATDSTPGQSASAADGSGQSAPNATVTQIRSAGGVSTSGGSNINGDAQKRDEDTTSAEAQGEGEEQNVEKSATYVNDTQQLGESEEEFIVRTCRYCNESSSAELERLWHCDGIWLHALRYSGNGWQYQAPYPDWATW